MKHLLKMLNVTVLSAVLGVISVRWHYSESAKNDVLQAQIERITNVDEPKAREREKEAQHALDVYCLGEGIKCLATPREVRRLDKVTGKAVPDEEGLRVLGELRSAEEKSMQLRSTKLQLDEEAKALLDIGSGFLSVFIIGAGCITLLTMQLSYLEEKERKRKERMSPDQLKRERLDELRTQEVVIDKRIASVTAEKQLWRKEIEDLEAELAPRSYREPDRSVEPKCVAVDAVPQDDAHHVKPDTMTRTHTAGPG